MNRNRKRFFSVFIAGVLILVSCVLPLCTASGDDLSASAPAAHPCDLNQDFQIDAEELRRWTEAFTENTNVPQEATPASPGAVNPRASLSSLLRAIQLANSGGYRQGGGTEDGWMPGPSLPNVVFILVDTLRADRVHAARNGLPLMPFWAALTQRAVVFDYAVTPAPWTKPAMAAIFTGLFPEHFRGTDDRAEEKIFLIPAETETMAEWLSHNGYYTFGIQTNLHLLGEFGFAQGFAPGDYVILNGATAERVNQKVREILSRLREPFFLYLHYLDPHAPYDPPAPYATVFGEPPTINPQDQQILASIIDFSWEKYWEWVDPRPRRFGELSMQGMERVRYLYDAEVRYTDDRLKDLVALLSERFPHSLYVFLSDHGEELFERGRLGHGYAFYEEQMRVPCMFYAPWLTPQRSRERVSTLGILPTLAALLGLPPLSVWEGRNLLEPVERPQVIYGYTQRPRIEGGVVYEGARKYTHRVPPPDAQLFDLAADPLEQHDLASDQTEQVKYFKRLWEQHWEKMAPFVLPEAPALTPEQQRQLQGLGYLGN
jgi:arylsulfatase A-like enzyme